MAPPRRSHRAAGAMGAFRGAILLLLLSVLLSNLPALTAASRSGAPAPAGSIATGGGHPLRPDALPGGTAELRVESTDPVLVPNEGIETNLTAYGPPLLPPNSAFQVAAVLVIGGYEAVFGLFQNSTLGPVAFYAIFTNATNQYVRLVYWPALTLSPGTGYLFSLEHTSGGEWRFDVNGRPFVDNSSTATFPFNASEATWAPGIGLTELAAWGGASFPVPNVTCPLAFAVLSGGGWYLPQNATADTVGTAGIPWGIEGEVQHPTLAPGEVVSGGGIASVANGTLLWTHGPEPVAVSLSATPTTLPSLGGAQLSVVVDRGGGVAAPGVYVYLGAAAGLFSPALVVTDATGRASSVFAAPNLSQAALVVLSATVVLFGFRGNATTAVNVTASLQAFLDAPSEATVAVAGEVTLPFRAHDGQGRTLAGLTVQFSAIGPAGLTPVGGITDASGAVATTLLAPGSAEVIRVIARIVSPGFWGVASVEVHVVAPSSPWWSAPLTVGPGLAAVAGAVLVAYLLIRRRRRGYRPLPPFPRRVRGPPAPPPPLGPVQP